MEENDKSINKRGRLNQIKKLRVCQCFKNFKLKLVRPQLKK